MNELIWVCDPTNHGQMHFVGWVNEVAYFECQSCDRRIAIDTKAEMGGLHILQPGDQAARHWGAAVDFLRFSGIQVITDPD